MCIKDRGLCVYVMEKGGISPSQRISIKKRHLVLIHSFDLCNRSAKANEFSLGATCPSGNWHAGLLLTTRADPCWHHFPFNQ